MGGGNGMSPWPRVSMYVMGSFMVRPIHSTA
jgi:hypothetical protein